MTPQALIFRPLTPALIPSALRLSTLAGWNQTAVDWLRLTELRPGGVWVWTDAGEVRASYSVVGYGNRLAWIGMVLVDPEYRGRGLGTKVFSAALEEACSAGFTVLGLDASEFGEPFYRKHRFEVICPITRWEGHPHVQHEDVDPQPLTVGLHAGILAMDRECTGEDRSELLGNFALAGCRTVSIQSAGETVAYAVARPGRLALHIGPVLATSMEHFTRLMEAIARAEAGKHVVCDVLEDQADTVLRSLGLRPARQLKRMTRPRSDRCLSSDGVWCGAGFELG